MNAEFIGALKDLVKEKGISEDLIFTTIEDAMVAAYKKNYANPNTAAQNVRVNMDRETGEIKVFAQKVVCEEVYDDVTEISIEDKFFEMFENVMLNNMFSGVLEEK